MKHHKDTHHWGRHTAKERYACGGMAEGGDVQPMNILDPQAHLDRLKDAQIKAGATTPAQQGVTTIKIGSKSATSGGK